MKKLLFVITKSNWGGAQRYVYDLATHLNSGYDLSVAAGGDGILIERLRENNVRVLALTSLARDINAGSDFAAFRELYRLFRKERPDIVHLNSSKAGALGALAARLARVPRIVFTVHGWPFNEPVPPASKAFRWLASLVTLVLCHKRIAVSHFDALHAPLGMTLDVIHNGIAAPEFLSRAAARQTLGIADDARTLVIGTIAELHKNKGVDILVDALPQIPEGLLMVIGEGEERAALEARIHALRLEERVELKGFVQNAATYLHAFDLFVLPSRTEALGYVLLEAGFAGVPVAAALTGGIPEIIEDGLTGALFPAYDSTALAKVVNELLSASGTREHYAGRLKEKVTQEFSLNGMIALTAKQYES